MEFKEELNFCTLFKEAVRANQDKECCFYRDKKLTYNELDNRSDCLLNELRMNGVEIDDIVAIYMDRNITLLTSIVAVLKNGSAYLPIDITHPENRKMQILSQSKVKYIITDSASKEELVVLLAKRDSDNEARIIEIDNDFFSNRECPKCMNYEYRPEGTAYIMFTSGSTGRPKGVMVKHKGMINHLLSKINDMSICDKDIIVESATQCFDISVWQFLSCLLVGGQVHILDNETAGNPGAYLDYVEKNAITIFQVVPSMLKSMLNYISSVNKKYAMKSLRWIALVGEALPPYACRQWLELFPEVPMLNSYGPTECSDGVSHYIIVSAPDKSVINMSIGKPIHNLRAYITKTDCDQLELVPEGAEGELCVAGIGVGKGYLYDEERTNKVFLKNPFSNDNNYDVLYKTGDLVKCLPNGDMEYLGRIDRQVKLRGFRIELGEIESVLAEHNGVKSCAVITSNLLTNKSKLVARKGIEESKQEDSIQLIAYVIENMHITDREYKAYLGERLPSYMVPERFVRVEKFPYNANGKLDVKNLPDPSFVRPETDYAYSEPVGEDEKKLANIWAKVLSIDKIGRDDYFMDLGGDSLLAMQLLNRVHEEMHCDISFQDIFTKRLSEMIEIVNGKRKQSHKYNSIEDVVLDRELYPLTLQQKQLWFMWKLYPNSPFYMLQGELDIKGCADVHVLEDALMRVVSCNDLLCSSLVERDGEPYFSFKDNTRIVIDYQDISDQAEDSQKKCIMEYEKGEIAHPFDLRTDALVRFKLFKTSAVDFMLIMTTHEMIFDAWSLSTFIREVKTVYRNIKMHENIEIFDKKISFKQYSVWESENITKESLKQEREYWSKQLIDYNTYLDLPRVNRNEIDSHEGGTVTKLLSKELSDKLRDISHEYGATLFMTLLAAFNALLYRYTGQNDIVIGTPHVNRNNPGTERLYGFFLNMLPIRTKLDDGMTFDELLHSVRDTAYGAIANSSYPFMWMQDDRNRGSQGTSPLFQIMFNMYSEKKEIEEITKDDLNISFREIETGYTKYDMTLYAQENGESIYIQLSYFKDMFNKATMNSMLENYEVLLNALVTNTQCAIDKAEYITENEKNRLLYELNDTNEVYDKKKSITELFEQCVIENKNKTALICNGETMTYSELNNRANCLAEELKKKGVDNTTTVGLCITRSFNTLVSILATLKLGATYVALDQTYPFTRLLGIIQDSRIGVLVRDEYAPDFKEYVGLICDIDTVDYSKECSNPEYVEPHDGTMNIVYTSSTTGKPKGVVISMQSVLNRLYWMWNKYPFNSSDVAVLQKSTALVAASWELFGALFSGIPTVVLTQEDINKPSQLWERLVDNKVTYLLSSPAFIRIVLEEAGHSEKKWDSLRFATTSAEPINKALVYQWYETFPDVLLLNLYGSTECSSNASEYDTRNLKDDFAGVPIGRPLSNVRLLILDKNRQLVPFGVKGELCIWGDCVSRGYLNMEELNKEKFIKDKFYNDDTKRIYCSGDVAYYMQDGNIDLVGRTDYQVKIRGYRVELSEIESVLTNHPAVKNAICLTEQERVVAYLVLNKDETSDEIQLKKHVREYLPEYMVPSEFRIIDKMPITNAGKMDRKAISNMQYQLLSSQIESNDYDDIEKQVKDIFVDVLGRKDVDKNVDFFDMGGNSLLSVKVVTEIERIFGVDIMISSFMRNSSIMSIAQQIKEA